MKMVGLLAIARPSTPYYILPCILTLTLDLQLFHLYPTSAPKPTISPQLALSRDHNYLVLIVAL